MDILRSFGFYVEKLRCTSASWHNLRMSLFFFYSLHLGLCNCQVQDNQLYGQFLVYNYPIDARAVDSINSQCFEGLEYINCKPVNLVTRESRDNSLPYYVELMDTVDDYFCLQCCGINQDVDTWDLECPITRLTALTYNKYGLVLHMAKRRFEGDREFVSCPLKRSACTYEESTDETLSCEGYLDDDTYLIGYTLTLNIIQYSEYFSFWKGVTSCSIETLESDVPLVENDVFKEKIILIHLPTPPVFEYFRVTVLFALLIFVLYPLMYYCRDAHCSVCCKKLIFFIDRCPMCRFVGAHPPDPRLVAAMEEKSKRLQGQKPLEAYPGKSVLEHFCWKAGTYFCSCCCTFVFDKNKNSKVAVVDIDCHTDMKTSNETTKVMENHYRKEAWLDDVYNFTDPDPPASKGSRRKIQKKSLKLSDSDIEPEFVSSVVDREKLVEHFPDDYVLYRAVEHPFLPPQPMDRGKQAGRWEKEESDTNEIVLERRMR